MKGNLDGGKEAGGGERGRKGCRDEKEKENGNGSGDKDGDEERQA